MVKVGAQSLVGYHNHIVRCQVQWADKSFGMDATVGSHTQRSWAGVSRELSTPLLANDLGRDDEGRAHDGTGRLHGAGETQEGAVAPLLIRRAAAMLPLPAAHARVHVAETRGPAAAAKHRHVVVVSIHSPRRIHGCDPATGGVLVPAR